MIAGVVSAPAKRKWHQLAFANCPLSPTAAEKRTCREVLGQDRDVLILFNGCERRIRLAGRLSIPAVDSGEHACFLRPGAKL